MTTFQNGDLVSVRPAPEDLTAEPVEAHQIAMVISADILNEHLQTVIVCPVIEASKKTESRIGATLIPQKLVGLDHDVIVLSLQIRTIPKNRIVKRISSLPPTFLSKVHESVKAVLDIN